MESWNNLNFRKLKLILGEDNKNFKKGEDWQIIAMNLLNLEKEYKTQTLTIINVY